MSHDPGSISFRPLCRSDFPLLQKWLSAPHVAAWWNESADLASIEAKYGPRDEGRAYVLRWSADFGFGPARHDRNVHGRGSSGKFDLGG